MAKLGIAALVALLGGALWMMVSSLRHFSGASPCPRAVSLPCGSVSSSPSSWVWG